MYHLAPADESVLTLGVALEFETPEVSQNHLSCDTPYDVLGHRLTKTNKTIRFFKSRGIAISVTST